MSTMLRWIGALGIAAIAAARCVIAFAPQVVFDFDPLIDPHPFPGLGPAGSLWLDALLLAACAAGLVGEALAGRRLSLMLLVLALIPVPIVIWHGCQEAGHLWHGMTWAAAALAAVAAAHLGRDARIRAVMLALMISVVVPLAVRGVSQVFIEHPRMVKQYEKQKAEMLRDRGWEPDSSQARIFERRLRQAEPTGWFATTNIYGSVMGAGLVLCMGMGLAALGVARRETGSTPQRTSGYVGAMALATIVCAWAVWECGSKGAIGATMLGVIVFAALMSAFHRRENSPLARLAARWLAPGAIVAALLGVIARGALLPESIAGERSLLFRWHYLVGAARVMAGHWLAGVGPDGFKQAYQAVRLPRSTEEVASAHNVFVDWLAMLGISGAAWVVLVLALAMRSGRAASLLETAASSRSPKKTAMAAGVTTFIAGAWALLIEAPTLEADSLFLRTLAIAGAAALAVAIVVVLHRAVGVGSAQRATAVALVAAVGVLLMHGQVEMTFYQPGAVVWCMTLIGLAGARRDAKFIERAPRIDWVGASVGGALAIGAMLLLVEAVVPTWQQQRITVRAAATIAVAAADRAGQSARRAAAGAMLRDGYERSCPPNVWVLEESARQMARASELAEDDRRVALLRQAGELADRAVREHGTSSSIGLAAALAWRMARQSGREDDWREAIDMTRRMTEIDPHGLTPWRRLGDVLWDAGRRAEAADAYRRALACDANLVLDELKRLPEKDRAAIEQRIERATGSS